MIDKKILQGTLKLYRNIKSGELKPEHERNPIPTLFKTLFWWDRMMMLDFKKERTWRIEGGDTYAKKPFFL